MITQNKIYFSALGVRPNILGRVPYKQILSDFHEPLEILHEQSRLSRKSDFRLFGQSNKGHIFPLRRKIRNSDIFYSDNIPFANEIKTLRDLNYSFQRFCVLLSFSRFLQMCGNGQVYEQ